MYAKFNEKGATKKGGCMSRRNRLCSDQAFLDDVLARADVLYLAMRASDANGGFPYVVPVNFVRIGQRLYIHGATEGTKIDLIAQDGRVAFALSCDVQPDGARHTTFYKSVCGTGHACLVTDAEEKAKALAAIGRRYNSDCASTLPEEHKAKTGIIRIDILALMGKCHLPPEA